MRIAQITDIHMTAGPPGRGGYDARAALGAVVAAALSLRPDLVILTGDLADAGLPEEYAPVRAAMAGIRLPVLAVPGNHDRRDAFVAAFRDGPVTIGGGDCLHLAHERGPVRLIGLDTLAPDHDSAGVIGEAQLAWLGERLAATDPRPVIVFMHHPPFRIGFPPDDTRCYDGDDLGRLLLGHERVLGVVCGHHHRTARVAWAGTSGGVCPAVAWEIPLGIRPEDPVRLAPQNPAFQLHVVDPELGLVTHTQYVAVNGADFPAAAGTPSVPPVNGDDDG